MKEKKKIHANVPLPLNQDSYLCQLTNCQPACAVKSLAPGCRKPSLLKCWFKLFIGRYETAVNKVSKGRTRCTLESPSRQSEFNTSSLSTLFKELGLPPGVHLYFSSWTCILFAPRPWAIFLDLLSTLRLASLAIFFNFLSLHWHLIIFPYKTFWRS